MDRIEIHVKILGARGSVPVSGKEYREFGTGTSCVCLSISNGNNPLQELYLDAGSGIISARPEPDSSVSILISHMHLDHLLGLPFFPALSQRDRKIDIYGKSRNGLSLEEALERLFTPPFWPLGIKDYPSDVRIHDISGGFDISGIQVDTLEMPHPGGSTSYRITSGGRSLVYAADFEHAGSSLDDLAAFAKDCDILFYDGQYTSEEYAVKHGFGHSVPEIGLELAERANVGRILFFHHDPTRTDERLLAWEKRLSGSFPAASFAREGEEFSI